ncbi:MAG: hypothetical protein RH942_09445 [Kiloniellaceae bacterium]
MEHDRPPDRNPAVRRRALQIKFGCGEKETVFRHEATGFRGPEVIYPSRPMIQGLAALRLTDY